MKAKHDGDCRECGGAIIAGDEIVWSRFHGARHTVCPLPAEGEERLSFAERVQVQEQRAKDCAEQRREWADSANTKASAAGARAHELMGVIPFGQPILVGHHSEGKHRRHITRVDSAMHAAAENSRKADQHAYRAEWYDMIANRRAHPVYLSNRLEEARTEVRDIERRLQGAGMIEPSIPTGERKDRLDALLAEYQERATYWEEQLRTSGGMTYSRENVKAGDLVTVRRTLCKVLRSSPKTITVLYLTGACIGWYWMKYPYAEIKQHFPQADLTPDQDALVATVKSVKETAHA